MKIPFSKPSITEEEIQAVVEVLGSSWLTIGPKVKKFEELLAGYTGAQYVAAVDSCTSALTLSLKTVADLIGPGPKKALVPALTFVATANAAHHAGFSVEFCDVGDDGNMDVSGLDYYSYCDVVVPVHFAGQVCDLRAISKFGDIVEDAAHAIGATYDGVSVGLSDYSLGACFSFYPTKNMTTIEGGAFITSDEGIGNRVKELSLHGFSTDHISRFERSSIHKSLVTTPGYKANMTDVEAAIGIVQLSRLNSFIKNRKKIVQYYNAALPDIEKLAINGRDHVWHMYIILVPKDRDIFVSKCREKDIMVGIHYSPTIPEHPFYNKGKRFPNAERISQRCASLPLYNDMTLDDAERVVEVVKELI